MAIRPPEEEIYLRHKKFIFVCFFIFKSLSNIPELENTITRVLGLHNFA